MFCKSVSKSNALWHELPADSVRNHTQETLKQHWQRRAKTDVIKIISSTERDIFSSISSKTNNRFSHMKGEVKLGQRSAERSPQNM